MPRVAPARNTFNAGIYGPFVEARTDHERYPASLLQMHNYIPTPQGPMLRRSGTMFDARAAFDDKPSALIPFVFTEDQSLDLEFADGRIRFQYDDGLQVLNSITVTAVLSLVPLKITAAGLGAVVGDQVLFEAFHQTTGLNGVTAKVTAVATNDYTFDINLTGSAVITAATKARRVYHVASPYAAADVSKVRGVQILDIVYLFCEGYRNYKLARYGATDWRLTEVEYVGGPYMPERPKMGRLTIAATGNPIPNMSNATTPSGVVVSDSAGTGYLVFDGSRDTSYVSAANQAGYVGYQFTAPIVINGYTIYRTPNSTSNNWSPNDVAPNNFTFEGSNDGTNWTVLDSQPDYVLYENGRSAHLKFENETAYEYYRLNVRGIIRNGALNCLISALTMTPATPPTMQLTLSGTYTNLNRGAGFLSTDVGRLMRLKDGDQHWRNTRIIAYHSATSVTVQLLDEPFTTHLSVISQWQIGYFSDTTGWPTCGTFFDDRLWVANLKDYPDFFAGSVTGAYNLPQTDFSQRTPVNEVLDTSAIVAQLNARRLSHIRWMQSDERGLLLGGGSGEYVIVAASSNAEGGLTARNVKARNSTQRGSANVDAVKIDKQVLYVQAGGRTVREFAYVFEADGYKSPSLSIFAPHIGASSFVKMDYAAEPHSIVWFLHENGTVSGLTYNREENVIGWHTHDFAGGVVESIACRPSEKYNQDVLSMVVRREINGATRRYIERLSPFFDFNTTIEQGRFLDCALYYEGEPTNVLTNAWHLEGRKVDLLIDGVAFLDRTVNGGEVALPVTGSKVLVGLYADNLWEIAHIEAGGVAGSAQPKETRVVDVTLWLWRSAYGEIGVRNEQTNDIEYAKVEYGAENFASLEPTELYSGLSKKFVLPQGFNRRKTVFGRQRAPFPFNVMAVYPTLDVAAPT